MDDDYLQCRDCYQLIPADELDWDMECDDWEAMCPECGSKEVHSLD